MRVLLVDDDLELLDLLGRALVRDDHDVRAARSLDEARRAHAEAPAEVIVLDLALPGETGLVLCRELRAAGDPVPVLLLTAHSEVSRRVEGLDSGADDFLGKPFSVAELRARVRALGRRRATAPSLPSALRLVSHGGVELDFAARHARVDGQPAALTAMEWAVLEALSLRRGRVVARDVLLEEVWGDVGASANGSLEVLVGRIRRKVHAGLIRTLRGEGYAFGLPDAEG